MRLTEELQKKQEQLYKITQRISELEKQYAQNTKGERNK